MKNQPFYQRLSYAFAGVRAAFATEANFRIQLALAALSALILWWLRPPLVWVALSLISATLVLVAELMNTALEHLADRLHPDHHPAIQIAKDCAAGAVLLASLAAAAIGLLTLAVGLKFLHT